MLKLIEFGPYFSESEPSLNLIQIDGDGSHLVKKAADQRINDYVTNLQPRLGKFYLHILAMGAGEYYGANRNADFFPEDNLKLYYKTFEDTGHIFRNHINKDPARAIGKVIYAIYNERMHRVELIAEVDEKLGRDIYDRIANGDYPATSMACKTPYDKCSICGNEASSRQAYCSHLRSELGKTYPDGRKVMALNVAPLRFFDQSIVVKPADVTSGVLQKVAFDILSTVGSAELAEEEGLAEKTANLKKFSELIKEISDGQVVKASPELDKIIANTQDPPLELIKSLAHVPLKQILSGFISLGISPSTRFLAELIAVQQYGSDAEGFGELADLTIKSTGIHDFKIPEETPMEYEEPHPFVVKALAPFVKTSSYNLEEVEKRAGLGYNRFGWDPQEKTKVFPGLESQETSLLPAMSHEQEHSLFKSLLGVGVSAILAKWFITKEIEKQLDSRAKIVIVKRAMYNDLHQVDVTTAPPPNHQGLALTVISKALGRMHNSAARTGQFVIRVVKLGNRTTSTAPGLAHQ